MPLHDVRSNFFPAIESKSRPHDGKRIVSTGSQDFGGLDSITAKGAQNGKIEGMGISVAGSERHDGNSAGGNLWKDT